MSYDGYSGGDGERALVIAANEILRLGEADTVTKIKQQYWPLGEIMEIANKRGYTKRLGTKGWIASNLRCSHTHAYDCLNAFRQRQSFDEAYRWFQGLNTGWQPTKMTGPRFALEIIKAWEKRNQSENEALAEATKKSRSTAKDAVEAAKRWEARFVRLRDEHRKLAKYADREPVVLQAIELEIATEAGEGASQPGLTGANAVQGDESDPVSNGEDGSDLTAHVSQDDPQPTSVQVKEKKQRKPRQKKADRNLPTEPIQASKETEDGSYLVTQPVVKLGDILKASAARTDAAQQIVRETGHVD